MTAIASLKFIACYGAKTLNLLPHQVTNLNFELVIWCGNNDIEGYLSNIYSHLNKWNDT